MTTFCWTTGTYLHRSKLTGLIGVEASNPGVGPGNPWNESDRIEVSFYSWLPIILLCLAILSYVPRAFWKHCEGKIAFLVHSLVGATRKVLTRKVLTRKVLLS